MRAQEGDAGSRLALAERGRGRLGLAEQGPEKPKEILPYVHAEEEDGEWPKVLNPRKRDESLASQPYQAMPEQLKSQTAEIVEKLMATYLRMEDVGRILQLGMSDSEGDPRGWGAVALIKLKKFREAAMLAGGPDGQTPCDWAALQYVSNALAKAGAFEGALTLARLQMKLPRNEWQTPGLRTLQNVVSVCALYLQATAENASRYLAAHGARVSLEIEKTLTDEIKGDIMACTPNRRYRELTEGMNQVLRWYGRARLIPQALRLCEVMTSLGIPRDDMTYHFLSRGCVQQYRLSKRVKKTTLFPKDNPQVGPEVVFIGRVNAGKSAMINALLADLEFVAPVNPRRAFTRKMTWYDINYERAGLPRFSFVDTVGLGTAGVKASATRDWPDLIYDCLQRRSVKHVFHLVDARNHKLLPADRQLVHLMAKTQRKSVKYTIVITKIDVVTRRAANETAENIKKQFEPYCDVEIIFASPHTKRGIDHMWSLIWQSVSDNPRGRKSKELGARELLRLENEGIPKEDSLMELFGFADPGVAPRAKTSFDTGRWVKDAGDTDPHAVMTDQGPNREDEEGIEEYDEQDSDFNGDPDANFQWDEDLDEEELKRMNDMWEAGGGEQP